MSGGSATTDEVPLTDPAELREVLQKSEPLWEQLTTAEQEQFLSALVAEVPYEGCSETVTVGFRSEGIKSLCAPPGVTR